MDLNRLIKDKESEFGLNYLKFCVLDQMNEILDSFNRLRVREVKIKCLLDHDARLLSISGWSRCLIKGVVISLTIVDETDELEWTCMIDYEQYGRLADEPFQMKISSASTAHRFVVSTRVLRRILKRSDEPAGVECYEVTGESSCMAKASRTTGISMLPGKKLRFLRILWHRPAGWQWSPEVHTYYDDIAITHCCWDIPDSTRLWLKNFSWRVLYAEQNRIKQNMT